MRHAMRGRKLGRTSSHREALFRNQLQSLVLNERIITTLPKAKELRPIAEKVITRGKHGTVHDRRWVLRWVLSRDLVKKLFDEIHSIESSASGAIWERLLMAVKCPFVALSATLGNTDELVAWLASAEAPPEIVYVVHGEPEASEALARRIEAELVRQRSGHPLPPRRLRSPNGSGSEGGVPGDRGAARLPEWRFPGLTPGDRVKNGPSRHKDDQHPPARPGRLQPGPQADAEPSRNQHPP